MKILTINRIEIELNEEDQRAALFLYGDDEKKYALESFDPRFAGDAPLTIVEVHKEQEPEQDPNELCRWCGKKYEDHLDYRSPDAPIPRMPCIGLKANFFAE